MPRPVRRLVVVLILVGLAATRAWTSEDLLRAADTGRSLTPTQAREHENRLLGAPADLPTRVSLLSYYWATGTPDAREARLKHVLWLIGNQPESPAWHFGETSFSPEFDAAQYAAAAGAWQRALSQAASAQAYENASVFFSNADSARSRDLLRQSRRLLFANLEALATQGKVKANRALLSKRAKAAYEAGESAKAKVYAEELLKTAGKDKKHWNYGGDTHQAHTLLGLLALAGGHTAQAKKHLVDSANVRSSPVLASFGPSMRLARALWERGEQEAVLSYLQACGAFWTSGAEKLAAWAAALKRGETPDFGPNETY